MRRRPKASCEQRQELKAEAIAERLAAEAAKAEREQDAELNKRIAKEFNISTRHARHLRKKGRRIQSAQRG